MRVGARAWLTISARRSCCLLAALVFIFRRRRPRTSTYEGARRARDRKVAERTRFGSDAVRLWTRRQTAAAATCKRFKRNEAALAGLGKSIYVGRPVRLALGVGPDIIHPPACVERTASNALVCDLRSGAFAMSVLAARSHPCALRA